MSLFEVPTPTRRVYQKPEGSPLRSPRDSSSIGKEWKWVNQGNGRSDTLSGAVAAISRKVTAREPLGAFDQFYPFKIYQLPYEFRTTHASNDWQKFRVRAGFVEMIDRSEFADQRVLYVPVTGQGIDNVFPAEADIYTEENRAVVNQTSDVFLDPIVYDFTSQLFVFYIQLSSDPTARPTATLKVTNINGDSSVWGLGGYNPPSNLLNNFESTPGFDQNQIPIGAVIFQDPTTNIKLPVGWYPTGLGNGGFEIVQIYNRNITERFPDSQMRFVEPSAGSGSSGIEWDSALQYYRGDVVTVTSGGSAITWLALAQFPNMGTTPATTDWTKIADFTP